MLEFLEKPMCPCLIEKVDQPHATRIDVNLRSLRVQKKRIRSIASEVYEVCKFDTPLGLIAATLNDPEIPRSPTPRLEVRTPIA